MRKRVCGRHTDAQRRRFRARPAGARGRRGRLVSPAAGAGAVILLLAAAAIASAAAAGGNAKAIALYAKSQAAMARFAGISFTGTGVSYEVIPANGYDNFRFDFGTTPPGYKKAVDHVQIVQSGGLVTEEVDTMTAPGLPDLRLWQHGSVGEVGEVMSKTPCAETIPPNNANYLTVGKPFVSDSGYQFSAFKKGKHGRARVLSTWSLSGGTAHETDTISRATGLWIHSHVLLEGGPYNGDTLTEADFHYSISQAYESPPQLGRC